MASDEELERLRRASEQSASKARALLDDELETVMSEVDRLEELKPDTVDPQTYDRLIETVREASRRNESIATLRRNVENLGESAVSAFKEVAAIAKSALR